MRKFLSHNFKKICSEPRGSGIDEMIQQAIAENKTELATIVENGEHKWIENILDPKALMFALDQLYAYYDGEAISDEQWALAGYYAFKHFESLDLELTNEKTD